MFKRYALYLFRWQLSTPILAICVSMFIIYGPLVATIIANLIGGCIFFWVDKMIFKRPLKRPKWEIEWTRCYDCNKYDKCFRLVESKHYDGIDDVNPQFRCSKCSDMKSNHLKELGVWI